MKTFKDDNELIHAFLQNELSEEQRKEVAQRINSDKDFALEVEVAQVANEAIVHHRLFDVKSSLGAIMDNNQQAAPPSKKWTLWLLGLFIIAGILTVWFNIDSTATKNSQDTIKPSNKQATDPNPEASAVRYNETQRVKKKTVFKSSNRITEAPNLRIESKETLILAKLSKTDSLDIIADEPSDTVIDVIIIHDSLSSENSAVVINCDQVIITADVLSKGTCPSDQDGKVTIITNSIEGDHPPYTFSLFEQGSFTSASIFSHLEIGYHEIYIKDSDGCIAAEEVYIEELPCNEQAIFAPDEGESWEIPNSNNQTGFLILFDRTGGIIQKMDLNGDLNQSWDGHNLAGITVPMGEYRYQIKYSDGEIKTGSVTVVR